MGTTKRKTKKPPKSVYRLALLDANGQPTAHTFDFPRVTGILDAVVAKPRLQDWYYRKGIEGLVELRKKYGEKLPKDMDSVRSLLYSEGLSPYSAKKKAADTGRSLHKMLESLAGGKRPVPDSDLGKALLSWWDSRGLSAADVVALETPLVSFRHAYAGTVDLIYRDSTGQLVLTDLKSGNYVYWTHFLQGNAYKQAWEENGGEAIGRVSVVHVNMEKVKNDEHWEEVVAPEVTFETFEHVLKIYRELPTNWKPTDIPEEQEDEDG